MLNSRFVKAFIVHCLVHISLTLFICGAFQCIVIKRLFNPYLLLCTLVSNLLQLTWLFSLPFLFMNILLLSRIHIKSFSVNWWIPEKRLQYLSQLLQPSVLVYFLLYMIIFSWLLNQYVSLAYPDLPYLLNRCTGKSSICIDPTALLVFLTGLVFGFKFSLNYFANNLNVLKFTACSPSLITFIKSKLKFSTLFDATHKYGIGVDLFGLIFGAYVITACLLNEFEMFETAHTSYLESIWWNCITAVSDLHLLFSLLTSLVLLAFNLHISFDVFDHILTKCLEAPLGSYNIILSASSEKKESPWNLSNCLSSDSKLLQYLAFSQLKDMALDPSPLGQISRSHIFSISQPGGHPHNWQGILKPSLNLIRKFTEKLKKNNSLDEKDPSSNGFSHALQTHKPPPESQGLTLCQKLVGKLKEFPLFCYLLLEIPDASNRKIFAEALPVIWAVQGLSNLVAASFYDDTYGVVQRNIVDILTTLVELQQVVDKVGRGIPLRRSLHSSGILFITHLQPQDLQLRKSLRLTLRSSLYIIANTFKESLREIPVPEEVANKLNSYLNFQEG